MNKKDIKFIIGCFVIVALACGIYFFIDSNHQGEKGIVEYQNEVLFEFNLNKNDIYEFKGSYGVMHLEVKDGKFRVIEVECPNHTCEQMGWHDQDSISPIVCLPNEVVIYTTTK
ncbi:MAG: NusG domain II-containing protein [Traorella sp.]